MLTITEVTRKIFEAKVEQVKNNILQEFYENILSSALSYQRTEGEITLDFDNKNDDMEIVKIAVQKILKDDYNFKKYVSDIDISRDNYDITIMYDLEKPYKELDTKTIA